MTTPEAAIHDYFSRRMPGYRVESREAIGGLQFNLVRPERSLTVTFMREFLNERSGEEALKALDGWNLAGELERAEGLPMIVEPAGIRLASSN